MYKKFFNEQENIEQPEKIYDMNDFKVGDKVNSDIKTNGEVIAIGNPDTSAGKVKVQWSKDDIEEIEPKFLKLKEGLETMNVYQEFVQQSWYTSLQPLQKYIDSLRKVKDDKFQKYLLDVKAKFNALNETIRDYK